MSPKEIREAASVTQMRVAVAAGVSEPLVRLFEASPDAVKDKRKRAAIAKVYASIAKNGELVMKVAS